MSTDKPVVVYGASGYTGKLVCEFLRHFQIPFVAAGRNGTKLEKAMSLVPGIETAEYEVREVAHEADALVELFQGAKVVCNTVGPFILWGEPVVEACVRAGCHYLDTTGEQAFLLESEERYGAEYEKQGLTLMPALAYMHAVLEIAMRACTEHPEIDTIEACCIPTGTPTLGSVQSIFHICRRPEYFLSQGELTAWPPASKAEIVPPHSGETLMALPWSGMPVVPWFRNHERVRNVRGLTCFTDRGIAQFAHDVYTTYHEKLADLPEEEQLAALDEMASQMQPGEPPRENPLIHRNYDFAIGTGTTSRVRYAIYSHSPYLTTGLVQAYGADRLIRGSARGAGLRSPSQAFGHESLLGVVERFGYGRMVRE